MKKILRRIVLCALMLFVLSLCIGCKSKTKKNEETTTDVPKDDGQIVIMSENKFNYRVVRGDNATDGEKKATGTLVTGLEDAAGTEIDVVTDWEGVPENEEIGEILVGRTNRPDSEKAYDGLSEKDYIIRVSDKSIVIAGGSDASLKTAVDYFMKQCVIQKGDRITVNADTDILITLDDSKGIAIACIDSSVTYLDELKNSLSVVCRNVTVERDVAGINAALDTEVNKIVIFAGADKVPAGVMNRLNSYLKSGGRILTLGGPAFETQLYESEGEWVTGDQFLVDYVKNVASDYVQTVIDASKRSDVDSLKHSSDVSSRLTTEIGTFGAPNSKYQLHVSMDNVNNWDLIIKSFKTTLSNVYGIGFYAKGSENTDKLYVEIRDSFNSRWYAVVGVDDEWGLKMLYASDFTFWDGPASSVKAGPAMNSLTSISIGFAKSGADYETGAHDFYLGNVSLYRYSDKMAHGSAPTLDCVSPEYEVYPVTNAESLQVSRNQIFLTEREYTLPQSAISCFPGRQGLGYDKGRANRFIPLLEYISDKGLHSGYAAYMNLYSSTSGKNGDYEGCIVASFTPCGNDFYDKNGICAVVDVATAMMNDFFLIEGGSDELIYPVQDGGRMTVGATCVSSAQVSDVNAEMTVSLYKGTDLIKEWKSGKDCQMSQLKSGIFTMKGEYAIPGDCPDRIVTVLSYGGRVIDRIEQSIRLWTPKPESERRYITTSNGHFIRDGKILNLFGVNYMPSTSTAEADEKDFDRYVMSSSYDPDVVHNDLLRIKEVGFNAISVYVHYDSIMNSNNILDLIMQCEDLGFYVDLSIRPNAYPMTYSESEVETLIRKLHFDQIDTIAAYDIAWEKRVDRYSVDGVVTLRQQWDGDWRKWIADQYGSLIAAEKIWGCSAPRNSSGEVIGATDEMLLDTSGVYDRIVAAYRRFVDDKVARVFIKATEHMRALDPNHLISFRMAYSGSPNYPSNYYAYDYQSLASSMDFMSPEAYAIGDDDESALQVVFANAYARYAAPDKPVVWKEFGYSVWTGSNFNRSNHKLQQQYDLYSQTLKYIYQCDTAGVYVWFYGNYRINENSDYGFLNPDGSDRPATALLREYAPKFLGQTEDFKADVLIEVERDYYPGGISGMYPAIKEQLREAFAEGKKVAVVNAVQKSENQKFYADEVLDKTIHGDRGADGDTSPLRYVNGMIYGLETERSDGKVYCTVTVCNTLQAAWRSGSVTVVSTEDSQISVDTVITDEVDYLGVTRVRFEVPGSGALKMRLSVGGYEFGAVFTAQI